MLWQHRTGHCEVRAIRLCNELSILPPLRYWDKAICYNGRHSMKYLSTGTHPMNIRLMGRKRSLIIFPLHCTSNTNSSREQQQKNNKHNLITVEFSLFLIKIGVQIMICFFQLMSSGLQRLLQQQIFGIVRGRYECCTPIKSSKLMGTSAYF